MNQKNIIIWVLGAIIVIAGVWYLVSSMKTATPADTGTPATDTTQTTHSTATLRTLASQGGNYTCTLSTIGDSGKTTGTIFASKQKMRLDFIVEAPDGSNVTTHTIRDGTYAYTWVEGGQPVGIKTALTSSSKIVPQPTGGVIAGFGDDTQIASDCHPWVPDATKLTPPTTISFIAQ